MKKNMFNFRKRNDFFIRRKIHQPLQQRRPLTLRKALRY